MDRVMDGRSGWKDGRKMDGGIDREIDKRNGSEGWSGWSEGWTKRSIKGIDWRDGQLVQRNGQIKGWRDGS